MTLLFVAALVSASVFFGCVGVWPEQRQRLIEGWSAERIRQRFRAPARRARLRSIR